MSKKIAVGIAATRGESMVLEGILKSMGIPASTELGNVISEFADVAQGWIYVDEDGLNRETVPLIEEALGNIVDSDVMDRYRDVEPKALPQAVVIARYADRYEAETMIDLLSDRDVHGFIEESIDGRFEICVRGDRLTRQRLEELRDYIGRNFEPSAFDFVR
ncbi:MAG: hypothetical protein KIT74_05130 [Fimbriimonadales bacterium]|nr:hypothetical protein [Fimbriimonadales bacterium]